MDLDGKNQRRLVAGVGTSILLDFNFREESVYWADKHTGVIYKASMRGAHRRVIYVTTLKLQRTQCIQIINHLTLQYSC